MVKYGNYLNRDNSNNNNNSSSSNNNNNTNTVTYFVWEPFCAQSRHNASGPGISRGRFLARAPWRRLRIETHVLWCMHRIIDIDSWMFRYGYRCEYIYILIYYISMCFIYIYMYTYGCITYTSI